MKNDQFKDKNIRAFLFFFIGGVLLGLPCLVYGKTTPFLHQIQIDHSSSPRNLVKTTQQEGSEKEKIYSFAVDPTWPPMEFINQQGKLVGFDIDLMNAIAQKEHFKIHFHQLSWDALFMSVLSHRDDGISSSVTWTKHRAKVLFFTHPYIRSGEVILVNKQKYHQWQGWAMFNGQTIGTEIAGAAAFLVEQHKSIHLKQYENIAIAIEDLLANRLQAVVLDTLTADYFQSHNGQQGEKIKRIGPLFTHEKYALVANKQDKVLDQQLEQGLTQVENNGQFDQIRAQWFGKQVREVKK